MPADGIGWLTFEDAHVPDYSDPPWATRAAPGLDLVGALREGVVDAIIVGNEFPADENFRTVFRDPVAAGAAFQRRHGFVPVNHMVCVRADLAAENPALIAQLVGLFRAAAAPGSGLPIGVAALEPAVALALRYASTQGLLPRPMTVADVWHGLPDPAR